MITNQAWLAKMFGYNFNEKRVEKKSVFN